VFIVSAVCFEACEEDGFVGRAEEGTVFWEWYDEEIGKATDYNRETSFDDEYPTNRQEWCLRYEL
jgi:hypothetical protein